jgi:hypothetical protein
VDHCFQDILTGDPFFYSHQYKSNLREENHGAVQAATINRMLSHSKDHNIELVGPERRRHCLVLKEDFADLELRKQKAATEWLKAQSWSYKHEQSMPEKKALWEMER